MGVYILVYCFYDGQFMQFVILFFLDLAKPKAGLDAKRMRLDKKNWSSTETDFTKGPVNQIKWLLLR